MRLGFSAEARMAVVRAAATSHGERAFVVVLERLLAETGAPRGRLVGFDAAGREVALVNRGPLDEERAANAIERAASLASPMASGDVLAIPLRLVCRPLGAVVLEGAGGLDLGSIAEAAARAAVGVGNGLHLAEAQARTEFLAQLAHEIRNPLAGILSFSDLLPDEANELTPKYIHLMAHIQEDAQKLKRLVEGMLATVQTAPFALAPVELGELCSALVQRFRPWAARIGVTLESVAEGAVLADREALGLAVANLLANAIAATPPSGRVAVRAEPGPDREVRWGAPGRAFRIEISDTGPGLDSTTFESARGGGLQIARDIIYALGGAIWAEDEHAGARLVLRLPVSPPSV